MKKMLSIQFEGAITCDPDKVLLVNSMGRVATATEWLRDKGSLQELVLQSFGEAVLSAVDEECIIMDFVLDEHEVE